MAAVLNFSIKLIFLQNRHQPYRVTSVTAKMVESSCGGCTQPRLTANVKCVTTRFAVAVLNSANALMLFCSLLGTPLLIPLVCHQLNLN